MKKTISLNVDKKLQKKAETQRQWEELLTQCLLPRIKEKWTSTRKFKTKKKTTKKLKKFKLD